MPVLEWSDALALDMPAMDDTHQEFVVLLAAAGTAGDDTLPAAWQRLIDHTQDHFGREDAWMRATGFASKNCHTTQHGVVLQAMREGMELAGAQQLALIREMAGQLGPWFVQHAQTMYAALALHLRSVGFDLVSGQVLTPDALPASAMTGCGSAACATA